MNDTLTIRPRTAAAILALVVAAFVTMLMMGPASAHDDCNPPSTTTTTPATTTTAPTTSTTINLPTARADYVDVAYGPDTRQRLDLTVPEGDGPFPLILFLHGGGWVQGDKDSTPFADGEVDNGYAIASANYRYANGTTVTYPEMLDDVAAAYDLVASGAIDPRIDPDRIVVAGFSAGAHLSALATVNDRIAPAGVIGFAGPYQLSPTPETQEMLDLLTPEQLEAARAQVFPVLGCDFDSPDCAAAALASPPLQVQGDEPPFLLVQGLRDQVVLPLHAYALADALPDATVRAIPTGKHAIYTPGEVSLFIAAVTQR